MKNLVIVESPSKSKTIEKYLGNDYKVVSSKGHIRDLSKSGKWGLGIDVDNDFTPKYTISSDKKAIVKELSDLAAKCDQVFLASDPDREGEAIAWHLANVLNLDINDKNRIVFNEITKNAVIAAFDEPRAIDKDLVKSQETRRILDRIIGFRLSKLLQNKIQSKSAGRVQSVALRLIVERENEIRNFISEEYWSLDAIVTKSNKKFVASLSKYQGKKPTLKCKEDVETIINQCNDFVVEKIDRKVRKKEAKLPFITSSLQQEASTKLGFGAKKTMTIAQKLYEGLPIFNGVSEGLITYMRSDSTRLSQGFVNDALNYIENEYGVEYKGKVKAKNADNAQDAHEAIRMTNVKYTPDSLKPFLTNDQYKLYKLIYARTLASLMAASKFDSVSVSIRSNEALFHANGSTLTFDGYLKIYGDYEQTKDETLPKLDENELLKKVQLDAKQHFSEPPLRYSEARLIKEMEENGIGRPSTYALVIETIQARGYAELKKASETSKTKVFFPTTQGELTDAKLQEFFHSIINVSYTANMESNLDKIATGNLDNIAALHDFYGKFVPLVDKAYSEMEKKELEKLNKPCPKCEDGELVYRIGKFGKFISCSNFPKCHFTETEQQEKIDEVCEKCGSAMVMKKGRFGAFLACSNYPECKTIKSTKVKEPPKETGELCPQCNSPLVERKSRFNTTFVGCSNYPKCRYIQKQEKKKKSDKTENN